MQYWIEVTGDYQWQLRLKGDIGLNVPVATRYKNMLSKIDVGDIVLHHITTARAMVKEHKSTIVGISKIKSKMSIIGKKLLIDLNNSIELPHPIKLKDYSQIEEPSDKFKFMIHANLQKYVFEIEESDIRKILDKTFAVFNHSR